MIVMNSKAIASDGRSEVSPLSNPTHNARRINSLIIMGMLPSMPATSSMLQSVVSAMEPGGRHRHHNKRCIDPRGSTIASQGLYRRNLVAVGFIVGENDECINERTLRPCPLNWQRAVCLPKWQCMGMAYNLHQ